MTNLPPDGGPSFHAWWTMLSPRAPLPPDIKLAGSIILIVATIGTVMVTCDAWVIGEMHQLPRGFVDIFDILTDFGKSGWVLFPIVGLLMLSCYAGSYALKRSAKLVIATLTVRLSFLFLAIGVPGLFTSFAKELIGRARPYVADGDPFVFRPFTFHAQYASLPSGHSTTAFAAAVAIGAVWPHLRPFVWS
jgi:membrane-associated phospholipid phosphatase